MELPYPEAVYFLVAARRCWGCLHSFSGASGKLEDAENEIGLPWFDPAARADVPPTFW